MTGSDMIKSNNSRTRVEILCLYPSGSAETQEASHTPPNLSVKLPNQNTGDHRKAPLCLNSKFSKKAPQGLMRRISTQVDVWSQIQDDTSIFLRHTILRYPLPASCITLLDRSLHDTECSPLVGRPHYFLAVGVSDSGWEWLIPKHVCRVSHGIMPVDDWSNEWHLQVEHIRKRFIDGIFFIMRKTLLLSFHL